MLGCERNGEGQRREGPAAPANFGGAERNFGRGENRNKTSHARTHRLYISPRSLLAMDLGILKGLGSKRSWCRENGGWSVAAAGAAGDGARRICAVTHAHREQLRSVRERKARRTMVWGTARCD